MIDLGLSRVHRLLARTSLPWRAVHVAGTNGKGSTCAYISAMFSHYNASKYPQLSSHAPLKHARFTSPHLIDRWDCITIDNEPIPEAMFRQVEGEVMSRNSNHGIGATEFEVLTATAFEIFTRSEVDVGVVEVGMGGRLDATNVLGTSVPSDDAADEEHTEVVTRSLPLVTAICSIALDHQSFLGDTISKIAREKAGIIKRGVPVVFADELVESTEAITTVARTAGASPMIPVTSRTCSRDIWLVTGPGHSYFDGNVELDRAIQSRWSNGAIAVASVWQALTQLDRLWRIAAEDQVQLLLELSSIPSSVNWQGRLQDISIEALTGYSESVLLDGAHNAHSASILASTVHERYGQQPVHWVLAMSNGKDVDEMLKILLRPADHVSAVEFGPVDGMPWVRPMPSDAIIETAYRYSSGPHTAFGSGINATLRHASGQAQNAGSKLVIAGSLYLVGDVMRLIRNTKDQ